MTSVVFIAVLVLGMMVSGYFLGRAHEERNAVKKGRERERKAAQIMVNPRTPEDVARRLDDSTF